MSRKDGSSNNPVKLRDVVSKVVINTKSKASIVNRRAAVSAMGETKHTQYGAVSTIVEMWRLYNPWIKEVKFGELSYETEDLVNIDLVIRYDYAEKIK